MISGILGKEKKPVFLWGGEEGGERRTKHLSHKNNGPGGKNLRQSKLGVGWGRMGNERKDIPSNSGVTPTHFSTMNLGKNRGGGERKEKDFQMKREQQQQRRRRDGGPSLRIEQIPKVRGGKRVGVPLQYKKGIEKKKGDKKAFQQKKGNRWRISNRSQYGNMVLVPLIKTGKKGAH